MKKHLLLQERLRREMLRRNITAMELARQAGVKNSFIYDILNGKSTNPSGVRLAQVADALQVSLSFLVAGGTEGAKGYIPVPGLRTGAEMRGRHASTLRMTEEAYQFQKAWLEENFGAAVDRLRTFSMPDDSMAPTLQKHDALLVDVAHTSPNPAGIFVLSDGADLLVKRVERMGAARKAQLRVLSDNPRYGAYAHAPEEIKLIGRVVWFARTL
ncbi:MAG: LexA family transcriptional regulator [Alphaproteobacteria bacterium]|nr:LexA family transcriptional regulator [Alphaproteobacteria bacterium]